MGATRRNQQLMLSFTEIEAGEARGNLRQGAEARKAVCETERPVSSSKLHGATLNRPNRRVRTRTHGGVGVSPCKRMEFSSLRWLP